MLEEEKMEQKRGTKVLFVGFLAAAWVFSLILVAETRAEQEAAGESEPIGLAMQALEEAGLGSLFSSLGLKLSGWIAQSYTFNPHKPEDRLNRFRVFDERSNDYRMNQFSLILERPLAEGKGMDWGFKVQTIYGADSRFIHSLDLPEADSPFTKHTVQVDPTQFYSLFRLPVGEGLTVKMGKYVTTLGYEVIDAPGNALYSHSYLFGFAIPFTHTGVQFDYQAADFLSLYYGLVRGWDVVTTDLNSGFSHMFGLGLKPAQELNLLLNLITGPETESENNYRTVVDLVATWQPLEKWSFALNVDVGHERLPDAPGSLWWGVAGYVTYRWSPTVGTTFRAEYFRDETQTRLSGAKELTELTLGLDLYPIRGFKNLRFRPEVRWDHAIGRTPFDAGSKKDQLTLAGDVIFTF